MPLNSSLIPKEYYFSHTMVAPEYSTSNIHRKIQAEALLLHGVIGNKQTPLVYHNSIVVLFHMLTKTLLLFS